MSAEAVKSSMETIIRKANNTHYFLLDEAVAEAAVGQFGKRVVCRLNDAHDLHCAIMRSKSEGWYIMVGAAVCKKLGLKEGSKIRFELRADESEHQFKVPPVFQEILDSDPDFAEAFSQLSEGRRRGLMALIARTKSEQLQIDKTLALAELVKSGVTDPRKLAKTI